MVAMVGEGENDVMVGENGGWGLTMGGGWWMKAK